jgi:hypothetical protein
MPQGIMPDSARQEKYATTYGLINSSRIMFEKEQQHSNKIKLSGLQPGKPYPNTTGLAGFYEGHDTPAAGR